MDLLTYCKRLPKVELHAHLTGSLSDDTVLQLLEVKRNQPGEHHLPDSAEVTIRQGHNRSLEECFKVFSILHSLSDSLEAIGNITKDVIQEFAADNVYYVELRTTPKHIPGKMTKKQYVDTVLEVLRNEMENSKITVRLLLSIDRSRGVEDARTTLALAKHYCENSEYKELICGLDVSGNPDVGFLVDYIPILEEAKEFGLKLAVHLAEVPNNDEVQAILKAGLVDRIGHGTFIHPGNGGTQNHLSLIREKLIPLEICLSSNVKSGTVKTVEQHHFALWKDLKHPQVICTDDKGVFCTTLSEEYYLCAKTFNLSEEEIHNLCLQAVEATFMNPKEKHILRQTVQNELNSLVGHLVL